MKVVKRPTFSALAELAQHNQWVCWRFGPADPITGKRKKFPFNPKTGTIASVPDSTTWGTKQQAIDRLRLDPKAYNGIGFVFTATDPFCGIDLDGARDPDSGAVADWAQRIIDMLSSYTEISVSKTGIHILCKAVLPGTGIRIPDFAGPGTALEIYDRGRFFVVTGDEL